VFDPKRTQIFLAGIGDEICFERIDGDTFDALSLAAEAGEFCVRRENIDER
jgi:hypothetical protein